MILYNHLVIKMKRIKIDIAESTFNQVFKKPIELELDDDANIIDAMAALDNYIINLSIRPKKYSWNAITTIQLIWNPKEWDFFQDVGIEARGPNNELIPRSNLFNPLPDGTSVVFWPEAGC